LAVANDEPVAFYPLDDAAPTAHDISGNRLNGRIGTSVQTEAAGLVASTTAMNFPGMQSSAGAVRVSPSAKLQPSRAASLESLLRFTSTPANYTVVAAYGQRSGIASYEFYFKGGRLIAQFTLSDGFVDLGTPSALKANTTYYAAATYDGTTARLYLNGRLVASGAKSGSLAYKSGYGLSIGDDASSTNPGFKGTISDVAVYTKALTGARVSAHYDATTSSSGPTPAPTQDPTTGPTQRPTTAPTQHPTSAPTQDPTSAPTQDPTSAPTPVSSPAPVTGNAIWRAGDANLGKWITANTYQCGNPVNNGTTFTFNLTRSGTNCGRNMANPVDGSGNLIRLADGATYTWTFNYIDGKPDGSGPGMGSDTDARSLIWQIHGYNEPDSPCTGLTFVNGPSNMGGPQMWGFSTCNGLVWTGNYTAGERDTFKIVAKISATSAGYTQLYRNGVLVHTDNGANYHNSQGNPWWNFGPYKWRWELSGGGGSTMTSINATLDNLTLTQQ
jgi:hypothetical protein